MKTFRTDIVVFDMETTGLCPYRHGVIEMAAVRLDRETLQEQSAWESRLHPWPGREWDEAAERVHGIAREDLIAAPPMAEALVAFFQWIGGKPARFAGWNVPFDMGFLAASCALVGLERRLARLSYHPFDVQAAYEAAWLVGYMRQPTLSLQAWCDLHGRNRGERHSAMEDVRLTAEALRYLVLEVA